MFHAKILARIHHTKMPPMTTKCSVVYSSSSINAIALLYLRKQFPLRVLWHVVIIIVLIAALTKEIIDPKPWETPWITLLYVGLVIGTLLNGWQMYRGIREPIVKRYFTQNIQYEFKDDGFVIYFQDLKLELLWAHIQRVWTSKEVLVLIASNNIRIPLLVSRLDADQKSFIADKLGQMLP